MTEEQKIDATQPIPREVMRVDATGGVIFWTYPEMDPSIPTGARRGSVLTGFDENKKPCFDEWIEGIPVTVKVFEEKQPGPMTNR